jgi:hypothetical protein
MFISLEETSQKYALFIPQLLPEQDSVVSLGIEGNTAPLI